MCNATKKFIFCTCTDEQNKSNELMDNYLWTLTKFLELKDSSIRGKIVVPKDNLGNDLTITNVLNQMNNGTNNFDFEYIPAEKDCLDIRFMHESERMNYFKISFKDGIWVEGGHPPFITISERIAEGRIRKN